MLEHLQYKPSVTYIMIVSRLIADDQMGCTKIWDTFKYYFFHY